MSSEDLAPWLQEIGRRPVPHQCGRPTPPMSGSIRREKELDERAAERLAQDFRVVIDSCTEDQEHDINCQILDAMTGNRLDSGRAYRLLSALFRKFDQCPGISRIDGQGNPQPLNRWGAA